jgi:hypothetical protein
MDIRERKPYTNWTSIIRGAGSAKTIDFEKAGMIMVTGSVIGAGARLEIMHMHKKQRNFSLTWK